MLIIRLSNNTMTNKYFKYYDRIISNAKNRPPLKGYKERHHIKPRCMGGKNDPDNLVDLIPEEHYTCHLLLVKMYPDNRGLIMAAHMMSNCGRGVKNKQYGWVKRKFIESISKEKSTRELLYDLYVTQQMSLEKMGTLLKVSFSTCSRWLKYYNIPIRTPQELLKRDIKKEELEYLYLVKCKNIEELKKYYNCGYDILKNAFDEFGIKTTMVGMRKKIKFKKLPTKKELEDLYYNKKVTILDISKIYNVSIGPVYKWFEYYKITKKSITEYIGITPPKKDELIDSYIHKKTSLTTLSIRYNVSPTTVRKWLVSLGVSIRKRTPPKKHIKPCLE